MYSQAQNPQWVQGTPRAMRWSPNTNRNQGMDNLKAYRQQLDLLTGEEVIEDKLNF